MCPLRAPTKNNLKNNKISKLTDLLFQGRGFQKSGLPVLRIFPQN